MSLNHTKRAKSQFKISKQMFEPTLGLIGTTDSKFMIMLFILGIWYTVEDLRGYAREGSFKLDCSALLQSALELIAIKLCKMSCHTSSRLTKTAASVRATWYRINWYRGDWYRRRWSWESINSLKCFEASWEALPACCCGWSLANFCHGLGYGASLR